MDDRTVRALNAINRRFYRQNAAEFDATRGEPWPGWNRILQHAHPEASRGPFRVLDVGCGNGRFAAFLSDAWPAFRDRLHYVGLDSSTGLLASARQRALPLGAVTWIEADFVEPGRGLSALDDAGSFSLIALFGVLHHVPGAASRRRLLRSLGSHLKPDGLLVLASWQFAAFERFRDKIVPWEEYNRTASEPIDVEQLEEGDHLLPWNRGDEVHRYCHFANESEVALLLRQSGFHSIDSYTEDGRERELNRYFICRFSSAQHGPKEGVAVR